MSRGEGTRGDRRPESFDTVAKLYHVGRPNYPAELVEDVVRLTGIDAGSRVLEIGCGSGQLSLALAKQGVNLVAVELGPNLAAIAKRKLSEYPKAEVVVSAFEKWPLPVEPFDLVISATAFHWPDPNVRVAKSAEALRPGGYLAIVETRWGVDRTVRAFSQASQSCFQRWDPHYDPDFKLPTIGDLPTNDAELEGSDQFESPSLQRYEVHRRHTDETYGALLATWSNVIGLDERARIGLLDCVSRLIRDDFAGTIEIQDTYDLWLSQRRADVRG